MDTAHSPHLLRLSKMLLAGIGVAFAWVLLSVAVGLSASQAHADDDPGLLGAVAATVDDTTSAATAIVDDSTATVAEAIAPVVGIVSAVAPDLPVAPIVATTVAPVVEAAAKAADSGVVAPIVESAVAVVGTVPVVGSAVSALGADDALSSVGTSVDGVLGGTAGAVVGTVAKVVDGTTGSVAVPPVSALDDVLAGATGGVTVVVAERAAAAPGVFEPLARAAYLTGAAAWLSLVSDAAALTSPDSAAVSGGGLGGMIALLRSVMQADSVLTGSAGAGPGAWVLVALGFVVAYRAWVRRTGSENDVAPLAPAYATDVSPD